jgi:hypothetical protein
MEAGLTPADYPLVRLVPSTITDGVPRGEVDQVECLIYFGVASHEFTGGLEALYEQLFDKRAALLAAASKATAVASVVHIETILDEDRIDAYKLMAMRVKIVGCNATEAPTLRSRRLMHLFREKSLMPGVNRPIVPPQPLDFGWCQHPRREGDIALQTR